MMSNYLIQLGLCQGVFKISNIGLTDITWGCRWGCLFLCAASTVTKHWQLCNIIHVSLLIFHPSTHCMQKPRKALQQQCITVLFDVCRVSSHAKQLLNHFIIYVRNKESSLQGEDCIIRKDIHISKEHITKFINIHILFLKSATQQDSVFLP